MSTAMATALRILFLIVLTSPIALAGLTEVWWNVTYVEGVNPDGLFPRRAIGVNGTWPPPPVEVSANDTLLLHATNSLSEAMTLHHHGMYFNASSWYDGAMGVSQCAIPPGESFTYQVAINEYDQWGTYWIHAHSNGQYVDGLRAPLVIHPESEAHQYDEEFTVTVGDWYHDQHDVLIKQFLNVANPGGAEPVPDAPIMYFSQNGKYLDGFNENATLPFEAGKTYRLRIVNTAAFSMFYFWIDGHQMRIIEVDGTDTQEMPVDLLSLTVAQRYSVLVTALNDTTANWAVHANMDTTMFDTVPDTLNPNATASITYNSSFSLNTPQTIDEYFDTNDTALVPIPVLSQYSSAAVTIPLLVSFDTMTDGTNRAMFNNITYNMPVVPTVLSALSLDSVAGNGSADVASAYGPWNYVLDAGDAVDIIVQNSDAGKHPFHLHGHKFQIIDRSDDYTNPNPLTEGQANPVRRDTVQVESGAGVTLRFIASNPGAWFFHCHIEWHLEAGLAVTLITSPAEMLSAAAINPPPSSLYSQCASQGIPTTGNAAGLNSTTDLTGLDLGPFLQNNGWHGKGIGAMFGCVLTATIGMCTVAWYALGERFSDEEVEEMTRKKQEAKEKRGRLFGLARIVRPKIE